MRVLVTGGAGFIGSHLTDALVARGDDVTALDDLSSGRVERLDLRVALHEVNITDEATLRSAVAAFRPELIFHLAAQIDVRASVEAPADDAAVNVAGTINVLEAARVADARVVFASSGGALYGRDASIPTGENCATLPESPYGVSKLCAEQYIGLYNRLHRTRHSVLRLANVYGPRQDPAGEAGVITVFCASALAGTHATIFGDGTQTRDYVYVADVVQAMLAAGDGDIVGTWNIGSGRETSVLSLAVIIGQAANRELRCDFAPPRAGELHRSALESHRAARDLNWRATTPLDHGIRSVYRWIEGGDLR